MSVRRLSIALLLLAGCSARAPEQPARPAAKLGTIRGTVSFAGTPPARTPLKGGLADPACPQQLEDEDVLVADHKVENAVVYLDGAPKTAAPPQPVIISQESCMYRPRVQGAVVGQPVRILNLDHAVHHAHPFKGTSTAFGQAQPPTANDGALPPSFTASVGVVKLRCDVHQWMNGYLFVRDNRYFAVTDAHGAFTIDQVPPGDYELRTWHERFGERRQQVTVRAGEAGIVDFTY